MTTNLGPADRILNCTPSRSPETDWLFEHAVEAGLSDATAAIPPSKDLREGWWVIGDQGSTGSCVGWASADSVLRWHFVKASRLAQATPLSPRFAWMAAKETDVFTSKPTTFIEGSGTSLKAALDIARKFGAVTMPTLPFAPPSLYPGSEASFYLLAARYKIASYISLGRNLAAWRRWLAQHGPILVRLDVDTTWDHATSTAGKLATYDAAHTRGGHAVALVGYTSDHFIVRNSWGTHWGDKGFAFASDAYAKAAFTEAYGVVL